jgi:hypothetical protein
MSPLNLVWSLIVLRPLRIYGTMTCGNNRWGTRGKVEVGIKYEEAPPIRSGMG